LIWQVEIEDKKYVWDESFEYANKLNRENYGGYDNWRVPTIEELRTILTKESFENKQSFTGTTYIKKPLLESMTDYQWFWSSTENTNDSSRRAWFLDFKRGIGNYYYKSGEYYVRCVEGR